MPKSDFQFGIKWSVGRARADSTSSRNSNAAWSLPSTADRRCSDITSYGFRGEAARPAASPTKMTHRRIG